MVFSWHRGKGRKPRLAEVADQGLSPANPEPEVRCNTDVTNEYLSIQLKNKKGEFEKWLVNRI